MASVSILTNCFKSSPATCERIIQNRKAIFVWTVSGGIIVSLGLYLSLLHQIPWKGGIPVISTGACLLGIAMIGMLLNCSRKPNTNINPRSVQLPASPKKQAEFVEGNVPTLKEICISHLICHPELTRDKVDKLPTDLVAEIAGTITDPSQTRANAHLFLGISIERTRNYKIIKIEENFKSSSPEVILDELFESGSLFLISPPIDRRTLKGMCQFFKQLNDASKEFAICLNSPTIESFFFELTQNEIQLFVKNLAFTHFEYILFLKGLMEISSSDSATSEEVEQKFDKMLEVLYMVAERFEELCIDNKFEEMSTMDKMQSILKILQAIISFFLKVEDYEQSSSDKIRKTYTFKELKPIFIISAIAKSLLRYQTFMLQKIDSFKLKSQNS